MAPPTRASAVWTATSTPNDVPTTTTRKGARRRAHARRIRGPAAGVPPRATWYRAEKVGTQYSKKERAERFKEPWSDRTVVESASYEATKGAVEQAALLQDRKWSTLNGVTLAEAVESKEFAM
ncbi:hypothetical protein NFJ02_03g103560 [Pycnococcus provasolii]